MRISTEKKNDKKRKEKKKKYSIDSIKDFLNSFLNVDSCLVIHNRHFLFVWGLGCTKIWLVDDKNPS